MGAKLSADVIVLVIVSDSDTVLFRVLRVFAFLRLQTLFPNAQYGTKLRRRFRIVLKTFIKLLWLLKI